MHDNAPHPWLCIPLADYEAHMALPAVGQAQMLATLFHASLLEYFPRSVALIGCAGGNGLEHVAGTSTTRVVAIDINPQFVEAVRARFRRVIPELEPVVADIQALSHPVSPVDLIFAGLLFEYVDVEQTFRQMHSMLNPGGRIVSVIQLASAIPEVTPSPYISLSVLSTAIRIVSPSTLQAHAEHVGLHEMRTATVTASGGKEFQVQVFLKAQGEQQ